MMSQALRKLTATLARSNTCCIFINQIREKIGVMFGSPETTTGGRALKFYSSIRLDIRRTGSIKGSDGTELGNQVKVKVAKNKLAPPFRTAEFDIMFNEGISYEGTVLDLAVEKTIVDKKGAWFSYGGEKLGQGRDASRDELKRNPKLCAEIEKKVFAHYAALTPQAVGKVSRRKNAGKTRKRGSTRNGCLNNALSSALDQLNESQQTGVLEPQAL